MRKLLKTALRKLGYEVKKLPTIVNTDGTKYPTAFTTKEALSRCHARGTKVNSVIDVGGSDGRWSIDCCEIFPGAKYLLVEALEEHRSSLKQAIERYPNFDFVIAAAGSEQGKVYFNHDDLFGGSASREPIVGGIEVKMTTIDHEVREHALKPPFLIKLDTHGFEIPILQGATETLKQASLVIIEAYNYKLTKDSLKYFELCSYMERQGFSTIEIADLMLRQHDASFWQMDLFFAPSSDKEFNVNTYT